MKNKLAIASAFVAASSFSTAEIVINDFLSFEGFIDMSYTHTDIEDGGVSSSDNSYQIDQVEVALLFDFDVVTGQIDIDAEDDNGTNNGSDLEELEIEQAFAAYHFGNGGVFIAGRFASMLGFEAFEPTGLYQYSFAYDIGFLPGYSQGVKYSYETDTTFFGIALLDEAFDTDGNRFGGSGDSSYAIEVAGSINVGNGLTWFLGGAYEDADVGDAYAVNTYATFETGAWIFAAEVSFGEQEALVGDDIEAINALIMANFAYSDQASVTGRISYEDFDAGVGGELDYFKYTLAHGYAFSDNLSMVTEVSFIDGEDTDVDFDGLAAALELIFAY
ncbi:MAG: outer membrane beta-barrel protein [Verrucomicrobiota bacterium]